MTDRPRLNTATLDRPASMVAAPRTFSDAPGETIEGLPVIRLAPPKRWRLRDGDVLLLRPDQHVGAVVPNATPDALVHAVKVAMARRS